MSDRFHRCILIISTLLGSWLGMQATHEVGHVLGAWGTGGRVAGVVLHPLRLSRTDLAVNPRPLVVAWSGPIVGVLLPLGLWGLVRVLRVPGAFVFRFFAGFCLIANGSYLVFGSFAGVGDAGDLQRFGCPTWLLWLFGAATIPLGLWLWHGQARPFGIGAEAEAVPPRVAYASLIIFTLLLALGLVVGGK